MTTLYDAANQNMLEAIRAESRIKHLTWALEGLCNVAERNGIDVTYWREECIKEASGE